jgi:hypothetical protein
MEAGIRRGKKRSQMMTIPKAKYDFSSRQPGCESNMLVDDEYTKERALV